MGESLIFIGFLVFVVVVIVHFFQKQKYFSAPPDRKEDLLFRINVITFLLLNFYLVLTLLAFLYGLRYPADGNRNILILLFTCPGLLVQLSLLIYSLSKKRLPSQLSLFLGRIMWTIIGIVMAGSLMKASGHVALLRFAATTEPLVQYVKTSMPAPCEPVYTYLQTNRPDTYFDMSDLYYNDHELI